MIYSFPSKPGSVSSFMEDEERKLGRQTHVQKTNNAGSAAPCCVCVWGEGGCFRDRGWGMKRGSGGLAGEGDWGSHCCFSHFLQQPCSALSPEASILVGSYLSPFSCLWQKKQSAREGQSGSRQRGSWQHGATSLEFPSVLCPHPHHHRQGTPGSKESPKSAELLPQSSNRIKRAQAFGSSGQFACDLHTSAYPLLRPSVKGCETK